jgi:hypothetical protein
MDKKILVKNISAGPMRPVWFPVDWQEVIKKRAEKERLPIYKYLMMISNGYEIIKDEKEK